MAGKPRASSTPKLLNISSRRPIGKEFIQSPISNSMCNENSETRHRRSNSNYEDENFDSHDSNEETEEVTSKEEQNLSNTAFCNCLTPLHIAIICILILLMIILHCYGDKSVVQVTPPLHKLSQEFPSQVEDFWLYIQVGVDDIIKLHQPKTFLFLYDEESKKTADKVVYKISKFAVCKLTNCTAVPVVLEGSDLNTTDILRDYGKIVAANKKKLEESGVMIIKNLEKIPGISAQAFHSFCDEYNPLVEKALFIFTMRVDRLHESNVKSVENSLRNLWNDIKDDNFYPLFTRISSNVLPIMVEQ